MTAAIDLYKRKTLAHVERACRFRRQLSALQWAEKVRRMEGGRRFRFDFAPYQREMIQAPYDPNTQMTVYMLASRLGKTEVMMNVLGHAICESPRRILVMYPTISQAEKWSKETLMSELVAPTPEIDCLIGDGAGRRKSGNTILHKLFPGGLMNVFGSNAPGEMRRAKGNLQLADEIDSIVGSESDEGDPLEIFWVRGSEYDDAIKIAASYPSVRGRSKIESLMLQSDWREWHSACIHCGHEYQMHRKQLRYDVDKPEKAILECPKCSKAINDDQRIEMSLHQSHWIATREFSGITGFQGNRMMSPHPVQKGFVSHLHWAAVQEIAANNADNPEKALRVLVNTFDGEPYSAPEEEKPDPSELEKECYDYLSRDSDNRIIVPAGVLLITCGVDVQGNRLEAEIVGHGLNNQTWGLGYHVLSGQTTEPEVWAKLDEMISSEFVHPSENILKIVSTFIDSRYRGDFVYKFTQQRQAKRVFPIIGSTVLGKTIVSNPKKSGRHRIFEIGTHEAKSLIYQRSHLRRDPKSSEIPNGYMHFPQGFAYHEKYFQMLLCEEVELKKASDGDYYQFFSNPDRLRNEPLDLRVYAMAAAMSLNPAYKKIAAKYAKKAENNGEEPPETANKGRNYVLD